MPGCITRTSAGGNVHGQHVLTRPDRVTIDIRNGGREMQRLGVRKYRPTGCHHEHIDAVGECDIAHSRSLGEPSHAIQLDPKNLS